MSKKNAFGLSPEETERMLSKDALDDKALYDSVMQAQFDGYFMHEVECRAGASREEMLQVLYEMDDNELTPYHWLRRILGEPNV